MPQRLEVTDADDRRGNGFLVDDVALVEGHVHAEPLGDQMGQHLELHFAHELHMDLAQRFVPYHAQQRVFLLEHAQTFQQAVDIAAIRRQYPVGQHRLKHRRL